MAIKRMLLTSDQRSWDELTVLLSGLPMPKGNKKYEVTINNDFKRSEEISRLSHVYYRMIGEHMGITPDLAKTTCKRKWGLNVLRDQSIDQTKAGEQAKKVVRALNLYGFRDLNEKQQLAFTEILTVTSIFTNKSMRSYMMQIEQFFAEQGLVLKSINEVGA